VEAYESLFFVFVHSYFWLHLVVDLQTVFYTACSFIYNVSICQSEYSYSSVNINYYDWNILFPAHMPYVYRMKKNIHKCRASWRNNMNTALLDCCVTSQWNIRRWLFIWQIFLCHISCKYLVNGKILKDKIYVTWNVRLVCLKVWTEAFLVLYTGVIYCCINCHILVLQYYRCYGHYIKHVVSFLQ
jgi:hypothetical protein